MSYFDLVNARDKRTPTEVSIGSGLNANNSFSLGDVFWQHPINTFTDEAARREKMGGVQVPLDPTNWASPMSGNENPNVLTDWNVEKAKQDKIAEIAKTGEVNTALKTLEGDNAINKQMLVNQGETNKQTLANQGGVDKTLAEGSWQVPRQDSINKTNLDINTARDAANIKIGEGHDSAKNYATDNKPDMTPAQQENIDIKKEKMRNSEIAAYQKNYPGFNWNDPVVVAQLNEGYSPSEVFNYHLNKVRKAWER